MSYTTIRTILDTQLQTTADLPVFQEENTQYDTSGKALTPYCRANFSPAEVSRLSTESDLLNGLYIVDLFYPLNKGNATASAMADAVKAEFPRGEVLTSGQVDVHVVKSWIGISQSLEKYYMLQVFVQWECEQPRG